MVEDRNTQITISTLGQEAPLVEKEKYDPDFSKRQKIKEYMMPNLK
jgi:phosphomannomutase